jgi:hypothetical protein
LHKINVADNVVISLGACPLLGRPVSDDRGEAREESNVRDTGFAAEHSCSVGEVGVQM